MQKNIIVVVLKKIINLLRYYLAIINNILPITSEKLN